VQKTPKLQLQAGWKIYGNGKQAAKTALKKMANSCEANKPLTHVMVDE
jgi:hypothetical protein